MNCALRISLLQSLNPDIISLNETHLRRDDKIDFEGYSWFGHNRMLHKRAKKASGGVGILVKNYLLDYFRIQVVDKSMDDIIGVRLEHRELQYSLVIFSCYLPPEGSTRGRDSVTFFTHLLAQVYSLEADVIYLCGDFNSRISNKDDCIGDIDNVPPRVAIDLSMNSHGESLLEFLRDCKCCVLNGRINPDTDNFTSISSRGRAVVDYIITPHDCLDSI